MANTGLITGNPMYVDAVAAVETGWVTIQAIAWVNDETAGDDIIAADFFELTDTAGRILISKTAVYDGDDLFVSFPNGLRALGVTCSSIDGGIGFIYTTDINDASFRS